MSAINHHPDEASLMAYAAGNMDEAFSVVMAAHVSMCPKCRAAVRMAEALGGELLEESYSVPVSAQARARMMAQLDVVAPLNRPEPAYHAKPNAKDVPRPLAKLLAGEGLDQIHWKTLAPGIAVHDLPVSASARGQLRLLRIGAGRAMPEHGHGGDELTLVLRGSYRDRLGEFRPGDLADLDDSVEHSPVVTEEGSCICLIATEAPTRMKGILYRMLQPWFGI